jgi:Lrp/AsnC family leucine-responsive transcriptional regulator
MDRAEWGLPYTAFVEVMMDKRDAAAPAVNSTPEILECHLTTGDYDYLIKAGVRHTRSAFTLRCLKRALSPVAS